MKVIQSYLTLCDPMARILEWEAIPFSRESSWSMDWTCVLVHCRQILYCLSQYGSPPRQTTPTTNQTTSFIDHLLGWLWKQTNQSNKRSMTEVLGAVGKCDYGWKVEVTWNHGGEWIFYYAHRPWELSNWGVKCHVVHNPSSSMYQVIWQPMQAWQQIKIVQQGQDQDEAGKMPQGQPWGSHASQVPPAPADARSKPFLQCPNKTPHWPRCSPDSVAESGVWEKACSLHYSFSLPVCLEMKNQSKCPSRVNSISIR